MRKGETVLCDSCDAPLQVPADVLLQINSAWEFLHLLELHGWSVERGGYHRCKECKRS